MSIRLDMISTAHTHTPDRLCFLAPTGGTKVAIQIICTLVMAYAIFYAWRITEDCMDGMAVVSKHPSEKFDEQSTPVVIAGGFVLFICAAYVFVCLKHCNLGIFDNECLDKPAPPLEEVMEY